MTLDDVARAAGVSRMTASYAFGQPDRVADKTRKRVLDAAANLGFRGPDPSGRLLRTGGLRALGLVLGESLEYVFEDAQATNFVSGIARECSASGYGLTIVPTTGDRTDAARITSAAVGGFVVWTTTADDLVLAAIRETRRPAVVHGGPAIDGFSVIGIDDRAAAKALALSVWADSKAPAVVSFPLDRDRQAGIHHGIDPATVPFPVTANRLAGFKDAAEFLGYRWESIPVTVSSSNHSSDAMQAVKALTATRYPVDAVVAMSDQQAIAAHAALNSTAPHRHRTIRLGGFDGSERAFGLGITSIGQSLRAQGARAARIALGIDGPSFETNEPWNLTNAMRAANE
nr:LacI family DNA-binding transcriptional regulator [Microbacterium aurum]